MADSPSMEANNFVNTEITAAVVKKTVADVNGDVDVETIIVDDNGNRRHCDDVNASPLRHIVSNIGCDDTISRIRDKSSSNKSLVEHRAVAANGVHRKSDDRLSPSDDVPVQNGQNVEQFARPVKDLSPRVQFEDSCSSSSSSSSSSSNSGELHVQFQDDGRRSDNEERNDLLSLRSSRTSLSSSSCSSSSSSSSSSTYTEARAPDGGWGWVVVFASFVVNIIADGITFSFGVIFMEFVEYFNESKSKTAWIGSLFLAIPLLSGPIASYLTDRYGCRRVSIAGGILAAIGFIISAFIDKIEVLYFTFGVLAGFGLSLCYVAAIVIVAYYFEKRRSFATGLSVCGSGIGTFIFPPFMNFLFAEYGWRGATLIMAGLFLNLCVCGALMRDLEYTKKKRKPKKERNPKKKTKHGLNRLRTNTASSMDSSSQYSQYHTPSIPSTEEVKRLLQVAGHENCMKEGADVDPGSELISKDKNDKLFSSLVSLPTFVRNGEKVPLEVLEGLSTNRHLYSVLVHNYPSLLISSRSISDSGYINEQQRQRNNFGGVQTPKYSAQFIAENKITSSDAENVSKRSLQGGDGDTAMDNENKSPEKCSSEEPNLESSDSKKPEKRRSILKKKSESLKKGLAAVSNTNGTWWNKRYSGIYGNESPRLPTAYLRDLKVHRHSLTYRGAMLNIGRYRLRASSCPDIYRNSMTTIAEEKDEWYAGLLDLWRAISDMMDFSYFKNVTFLLFAISNFLLYTWYDVPYVYLPDNAVELGNEKTASIYLISVIGIMNMLGEIAFGWAGDQEWINARLLYSMAIAFCGIFIMIVPLLTSYEYICVAAGGFGFLIAANYSLTSIILVESLTIERFTNAYGLLLLVQGVANLVGPPLAGWLYEVTGNFKMPFYLAGFFISISGCLLELTSCVDKVKNYSAQPGSSILVSCINSKEGTKSKVHNCDSRTVCIP